MSISEINKEQPWSEWEFERVNLGDQRLNTRLKKLAENLPSAPEAPINQASNAGDEPHLRRTHGSLRFSGRHCRCQSLDHAAEDVISTRNRMTTVLILYTTSLGNA